MIEEELKSSNEDVASKPEDGACANCGEALQGTFCGQCGQRNEPLRKPVGQFIREAFVEFLGFDGRLWASLRLLLFRPGSLTQAYLGGHRVRYVRPLRIYLIASLLFFFLLSLIDPVGQVNFGDEEEVAADTSVTVAAYRAMLIEKREANAQRIANQQLLIDSLQIQFQADSLDLSSRHMTTIADSLGKEVLGQLNEALDEALRADSVDQEKVEDLQDALDEAFEDLGDERDDLASLRRQVDDENRQYTWLAAQIADAPADSLVRPSDLERAAELMFDDNTEPRIDVNFPDWLPKSQAVLQMQAARTDQEVRMAFVAFFSETIRRLPSVMFCILPIFALLLKVLYLRREWYYSEHLVFGLHTHGFTFLVFTAILLVSWLTGGAGWTAIVIVGLSFSIPIYFYVAQKNVYGQGWLKTGFKAWMLGWLYLFVLIGGLVVALLLAAIV